MDNNHGWSLSSSDEEANLLSDETGAGISLLGKHVEDTPAVDKPECQYGNKCYRENPLHFKQYSHPDKKKASSDISNCKITGKRCATSQDVYDPPRKKQRISENCSKTNYDPVSVWKAASPHYFLLTTCNGISAEYNYFNQQAVEGKFFPPSLGIRDILSADFGKLKQSAQFNYCIDIDWLMVQYPREYRSKPLLIVHGEQRAGKVRLNNEAQNYPNIQLCRADLLPYGVHHTKMMLLHYEEGFRVVISTANLVSKDWSQKTQGFWMSPVFPPLNEAKITATDDFKTDLISYISSYKKAPLTPWVEIIQKHDLSSSNVTLIASVPGRHTGPALFKYGHMRLRKVLKSKVKRVDSSWPVIGQFSSIGSLGPNRNKWLCSEWLTSLASSNPGKSGSQPSNLPPLKLIFPSVDDVRCSLEGYPAGASIPYSTATAAKQPWLNLYFHRWKSANANRTTASPHIKSYTRISPYETNIRAAWFLLTSANCSKAAWGGLEKSASQLAIKSYELGVLFVPPSPTANSTMTFAKQKQFTDICADSYFHIKSNATDKCRFSLPYSLPLTPYNSTDKPWTLDAPHTDAPDRYGNMWVPS